MELHKIYTINTKKILSSNLQYGLLSQGDRALALSFFVLPLFPLGEIIKAYSILQDNVSRHLGD